MRSSTLVHLATLLIVMGTASHLEAAPRVSFELVTGNGFPLNASRKWIELFKDFDGTSLRIRGARGNEKTTVENVGTETSPSYHVVGFLLGDNRVRLLGGSFSSTDHTKISKWIEQLRAEGVDGLTAVRVAFGLTSEQLVDFHKRASRPVTFSTKGVRGGDIVRRIVRQLQVPFDVSSAGRAAFARNEVFSDELNGLSSGTALAATLRPLGLIWRPAKRGDGKVILAIKEVGVSEESWPVGWPITDTPFSVAPKLFESINVEIKDTSLSKAIDALQPRIDLPFLFDHNSMARQRVDLEKPINFPPKRASHKRILDQVFFQAGLASELRIDEAEKPFLWISTTKR